jgi:hypothetical protein
MPASTRTFFPIVPAYHGTPLPACPDGSGDLWWDDASYIRYQVGPPDDYSPEHITFTADSDGYCDGAVSWYVNRNAVSCQCHAEASAALTAADEPPF